MSHGGDGAEWEDEEDEDAIKDGLNSLRRLLKDSGTKIGAGKT